MVAILVLLTVIAFVTVDLVRLRKRRQTVQAGRVPSHTPTEPALIPLVQSVYRTPPGVFFEPGHTWAFLEEGGTAKLGIDDFVRNIVGRVDDFGALPEGNRVKAGGVIMRLRHGDRKIEVRSPMDGVVEQVNEDLLSGRELRGIEPYTESWLYRIKPKDTTALTKTMLIGRDARRWLNREVSRLKVFLSTLAPEHPALGVTAQDGGMPVSGLIEQLNDEEWNKLSDTFFSV
jgi:glycine cleavage system H protein